MGFSRSTQNTTNNVQKFWQKNYKFENFMTKEKPWKKANSYFGKIEK